MKWKIYTVSLLSAIAIHSAYALLPVTMSGPSPAIPSSIVAGESGTYTFTITNNTPVQLPLTVSGISGSITRTAVVDDCGNTLPAASSCKVGVQIAPSSSQAGHTVSQTLSINYRGRLPLISAIQFNVTNNAGGSNLRLVAVGSNNNTGPNTPTAMILKSTSGGTNWSSVTSINGLPHGESQLYQSSCFGTGSSATCLAVGQTVGHPLVVRSSDGGASWSTVSVPALSSLASPNLQVVSCNGAGYCAAAGNQVVSGNNVPLIIQSTNNGETWSVVNISGDNLSGTIFSESCSGDSCVAVGSSADTMNATLYQTLNGGESWAKVDIAGLPSDPFTSFHSVSCTGTGADNRCVAVGFTGVNDPPFVVTKTGGNWTLVDTSSLLPDGGTFANVSCTGSGNSAICAVAGSTTDGNLILLQTTDGGASWQAPTNPFPDLQVGGLGVGCTGSGTTAFCAWVGSYNESEEFHEIPVLAQTSGASGVWVAKTLPTMPDLGRGSQLTQVSCAGSGSTAACIVGGGLNLIGEQEDQQAPFILQSTNGGSSWSVPTITGVPSIGFINQTSATGG